MHTHVHSFSGNTPYEIGTQIGEAFVPAITAGIHSLQLEQNWKIANAKDTELLKITETYFPQYIEELKGMAAGANVPLTSLWSLVIEEDSAVYKEPDNPGHCTSIITNNGRLIGHTEDADSENDAEKLSVVRKILPTHTTLELFYDTSLGGTSIGINSFGFSQEINTLYRCTHSTGIPKVILSRFLLDTKDPDRDIALVRSLPRASGYHHGIVNRLGEIWNVELGGEDETTHHSSVPYIHTNHCILNAQGDYPDEWGTKTRYKTAAAKVKSQMSVNEMQELLSDTSGKDFSIYNKYTMAQMVIDFSDDCCWISLRREPEKEWQRYPLP